MKRLATVRRSIAFGVLLALLSFVSIASAGKSEPKLTITPKVRGNYEVEVQIDTSLPDGAIILLELRRHGLADDDPFVGIDFKRVIAKAGKASFLFDASKDPKPSVEFITKGTYDIEASFNSFFENNDAAEREFADMHIKVTEVVTLRGNGKSQKVFEETLKQEKKKQNGRKWVFENIYSGYAWNPEFWLERFGSWESYDPKNGNSQILRMCYFPSLNITLLVNVYKNEIITWRDGRTDE